jgi:hypothetical protein
MFRVEGAAGDGVELGARCHGDVGDDETLVMEREVAVDRLGQHAVAVVDEEDEEQDDGDEDAKLAAGADLQSCE